MAALQCTPRARPGDATIRKALNILARRMRRPGPSTSSPDAAIDYLRLTLAPREHEVFAVVLLDAQNRVIHLEEMFRGTVTQASVYPREVVKLALQYNAAGVLLAHNHPSGVAEPSKADDYLTEALKRALALVDVLVVDHIVIGGRTYTSYAERGRL